MPPCYHIRNSSIVYTLHEEEKASESDEHSSVTVVEKQTDMRKELIKCAKGREAFFDSLILLFCCDLCVSSSVHRWYPFNQEFLVFLFTLEPRTVSQLWDKRESLFIASSERKEVSMEARSAPYLWTEGSEKAFRIVERSSIMRRTERESCA